MRKRSRISGLVHCSAAVVLLAGLTAVCVHAQAPPAAGQSKNQTGGQAGSDAAPPVFPKRFHRAPGGQLYVPANSPIRMSITLTAGGGGAQSGAENSDEAPVILKEGPATLEFGAALVPVVADGTPPKTVLTVADASTVESGGLRVLGPNPQLRLTATDALSGVAATLISVDGAAFEPLPAGGPVFAAEGLHRLRYFSVDEVGNAEDVQEYAFWLDKTPPRTQLAVSGPHAAGAKDETVVGAGAVLTLTATDPAPAPETGAAAGAEMDAGVEAIWYRLDGGAELPYLKPLPLDALADGPHRLQFHAVDRVGNAEAEQSFAFLTDRQPPEISLRILGPLYAEKGVRYVSPETKIEVSARDAIFGPEPVGYRIDGATADTVYTAPFRLPQSEGIHLLHSESEDAVKNLAETTVNNIYLDLGAPATEIEYSRFFFLRDGEVVLNPLSQIALNTSDFESGVAAVTYSLDGGAQQTYTAPFSVSTPGEHLLRFSSVDRVGNREPARQVRLRVEKTGNGPAPPPALDAKRWYVHPKLGLMGPPGLPFELRIAASPDADAESYLVGSGPEPSAGPLTFDTPGVHTMKVALGANTANFKVSIDAAPPRTQLAASGARRTEANGVTWFGPGLILSLSAEDDSSGISSGLWKTLYSLDNRSFATYKSPLTQFSREGAYELRYYSLDNVGNAEQSRTFDFTVDTTPPETRLELRGPHLGGAVTGIVAPATEVALIATDNLSGVAQVQYRIDDGEMRRYAQPFAIGPLREGAHQLRYAAEDVAGNREPEHSWTFTVKSAVGPPSYTVKGASVVRGETVYLTPGCQILLSAAEGDTVLYALDGEAFQPYAKPIPAPASGNHRLSFHSVDGLGIASQARVLNLSADRTAPTSSLHFEGPQLQREAGTVISGSTRIVLESNAGPVGGASLEYRLNGGPWQAYTGPFTLKSWGVFVISYRARNQLMSTEPEQTQRFQVDSQGPAIGVSFSAPVENSGAAVQLTPGTLMFVDAEDQPAGLEKITCQIDDQPALIYRTPLSGFAPGKIHTVTIVADDLLGNRSMKAVHLVVKERTQ